MPIQNRSFKLKDDILRSSGIRDSALYSTGFNIGTIMNYTKMEGVNDRSKQGSFRKWTGMP